MSLSELLSAEKIDTDAVAAFLDGMSHGQRVETTRALRQRYFARLYAAEQGQRRLALTDMVPADVKPLQIVRHIGVNSLPSFRTFEKPMYRCEDGTLAGRNVQTFSWLTGHGYYTARAGSGPEEILFDYTTLPTEKPSDWPTIHGNSRGFSVFVYRGMIDYVRRVSRHVVIGEAWRNKKNIGQYFILVRQDP